MIHFVVGFLGGLLLESDQELGALNSEYFHTDNFSWLPLQKLLPKKVSCFGVKGKPLLIEM